VSGATRLTYELALKVSPGHRVRHNHHMLQIHRMLQQPPLSDLADWADWADWAGAS